MSKTSAALWIESRRLASIELSLIRKVMQAAPPGAINLALGELGFPMPRILKEKACEILYSGTPVYTPNAGLPELREAIANDYAGGIQANQVCVCNGAEEAVYIAVMALINEGDVIAIPDPDYTAYPSIAAINGAIVKRLPFTGTFNDIDFRQWEAILKQDVKLVLLSSPSNPTGFCFSEAQAKQFGEICNRYGIIVIVDEIYRRLYFDSAPPSLQGYVQRLICVGGISKSHCLSGWRLGWIVAAPEILPAMIKAKQYISTCSHWLSQKLAVFALSEAGLQEAENIRRALLQNRDYFVGELCRNLPGHVVGYHSPGATPYIMLQVNMDDMAFAESLSVRGVISVPGSAFGISTRNWVRINIGVQPLLLKQALAIMLETKFNLTPPY